MMKKTYLIPAVIALAMLLPFGRTAKSADDKYARDFFTRCAEWSYGQIELSNLTKSSDSSPAVKTYAASQVSAYSKILDEVKATAKEKGYTIPKTMGSKERDTFEHLQKWKGREFDARYMKDQIDEQKALLELFEGGTKNFGDAKDRDWAGVWHKNIRDRYDDAVALYEKVKM